jgi:hypothetical protein
VYPLDEEFRPSFWLWPNLLSLDAAFIAVVWQHFLSETIAPIHPANTVILGLSVWLVYTADRLVDTHSARPMAESPRHQFARAYRRPLLGAAAVVLLVDIVLAVVFLPVVHFVAGMLLVGAVAARFYGVLRGAEGSWSKEFWTALIFAAGVWTPILLSNPLRPGAILFALLCWWNCLAIDTWESPRSSRPLLATSLILAAAAFGYFAWTHRPVALAEALSAAGFCVLAAQGKKLSQNFLRVAVDFCLLSPLLVHAH